MASAKTSKYAVDQPETPSAPRFLTTHEVAELLRVKERKVYDLAAAGDIPHRRITGKLLFPADEILDWLEGPSQNKERPAVVAGSHDPLLDWAIRESGCGLATLFEGSGAGLGRFVGGEAAACGLHIPEQDGWNIAAVEAADVKDCVLIGWATRQQGLILPPDQVENVRSMSDLSGRFVALRQEGAGARALFEKLAAEAGLTDALFLETPARTESDAAQAVADGQADAALGLAAAAAQFRLAFLPLVRERFDLLTDRRAYFTKPFQRLLAFCQTKAFAEKANLMPGYDTAGLGQVRWLSE